MELGTKRALVVKKVAALQLKASSLSAFTAKTNQKRKNQHDGERPLKKIGSHLVASDSVGSQGSPNPPRHGVGKGLMMACNPVLNESIPP